LAFCNQGHFDFLRHDLNVNYLKYGDEERRIIAQIINEFDAMNLDNIHQYAILQTYKLKQELNCYGNKGKEAE
jgi:hypothetical protein